MKQVRTPSSSTHQYTEETTVGHESRKARRRRRERDRRLRRPELFALLLLLGSLLIVGPLRGVLEPVPLVLFLAALWIFLFPGLFLARVALSDGFAGVARFPAAFVLSTGLFGLIGVPVLLLHRSLWEYLLICGAVLILTLIVAVRRLRGPDPAQPKEPGAAYGTVSWLLWLPFLGLTTVLAYVSTVVREAPNRDSWIYLAYVRDHTSADRLAFYDPILGDQATGSYISFRTTTNGWLLEQAALSRISGIAPVDLVLQYLAPTLVVLSLLAVYALARILFGRSAALLAGTITALIFLVDLHATIPTAFLSPGNDFVARVTEDKYLARFLFLPVSLSLAVLYLRERRLWYLAIFTFVCWSVAVVHPIGLMLIGISSAGLGFFHLIANYRQAGSWGGVLGLGAAITSIAVPPVLYLLATDSPLLSRLSSNVAESLIRTWAASKRLLIIGGDSYVMHPALVLNPAVVTAYALCVSFVIFRLKRDLAAQTLLGVLAFTPLLIYVPPVSTPLAEIVGPWVLVRLSWPISLAVPLVLSWVLWELLSYARARLESSSASIVRHSSVFLPILLVVVLVAATSPVSFAAIRTADEFGEVPIDEASCYDPVFSWMQSEITEPTTVLAPYKENSCVPAYAANANVVTLRGLSRDDRAARDLRSFYNSSVLGEQNLQLVRRMEAGYVLLPKDSPLNAQLRHLPGFAALDNPGERYDLYRVDQSALTETPAVVANGYLKTGAFDDAVDNYTAALQEDPDEQFLAYVGLGLLSSQRESYPEAASYFEEALAIDPREPTLYPLLSNAYAEAGEPDLARLALENGVQRFPERVELRASLSDFLASLDPEAAVEVQRGVVETFPEVPEYRIKLGSLLSLSGDEDAAARQFQIAIEKAPLSAELHFEVGIANELAERNAAAIGHYERALELNPNLQEARERLENLRQ